MEYEFCKQVFENPLYQYEPKNSELNDLKRSMVDNIPRHVPRVTKLLDSIKEDYLLQWANSLGWKRKSYTRTLQEYAHIGTMVHEDIEEYFRFGTEGLTAGWVSFKMWWDELNRLNTVTDVMSEVELYGPYFGGTTDLYCKINGYGAIIDFKTSKNIGYKYVMQLAAYRHLMETTRGLPISYCIILQVDKETCGIYHVYVYDLSRPEVCQLFDASLDYVHHLACCYMYNHYVRNTFDQLSKTVIDPFEWRAGNNDA